MKKLVDYFQDIEVVGLCDYNPQGLALLLTYRMCSVSSSFEARGLQVPLRWLGLRQRHITALSRGDSPSSDMIAKGQYPLRGDGEKKAKEDGNSSLQYLLQPLSQHDTSKLKSMLRRKV